MNKKIIITILLSSLLFSCSNSISYEEAQITISSIREKYFKNEIITPEVYTINYESESIDPNDSYKIDVTIAFNNNKKYLYLSKDYTFNNENSFLEFYVYKENDKLIIATNDKCNEIQKEYFYGNEVYFLDYVSSYKSSSGIDGYFLDPCSASKHAINNLQSIINNYGELDLALKGVPSGFEYIYKMNNKSKNVGSIDSELYFEFSGTDQTGSNGKQIISSDIEFNNYLLSDFELSTEVNYTQNNINIVNKFDIDLEIEYKCEINKPNLNEYTEVNSK